MLTQSKQQMIEERLQTLVADISSPYRELFKAARYSIFSGGKRLRPLLTLATCEVLGGDLETALSPACALEMIHTYSMIHDDLPCMDDDDFRRGKPTLHRVVPEGLAVLTGDYLLTFAFEVLADAPGLSTEQRLCMVKCLSSASGASGMIGGQVMDIAHQGYDSNLNTLQQIHELKCGALITASIEFGVIIAQASPQIHAQLRRFASCIGLAYQIVDDILDIKNSEAKHGHKVSSDLRNEKLTYVSLLGIENAKRQADKLLAEAMAELHSLPGTPQPLVDLAHRMVRRSL